MKIDNPKGNFSFIRGISPYSAGAAASPGFEIERARILPPVGLKAGFDLVSSHLAALGRPRHALCGMELRIPRALSFEGFAQFNAGYISVLKNWDLFLDGANPVARTNVAPAVAAPAEPVLYAFSYTVPRRNTAKRWPPTFVVAGAGELPEGKLDAPSIIHRGDTSAGGMAAKAAYVMGLMEGRMRELGGSWADVTATDVYTVHGMDSLAPKLLLPRMQAAALQGATWHYSHPPIVEIEFEMDVRGCRREIVISA
jgi:hypothetical protein